MKTQAAQAAAMIRKHLKANGVAARVTSSNYSMGCSVSVKLVDALPATKEAVALYCSQFAYGSFDGMTDSYNMTNNRNDIPQAKFVQVTVDYSPEIREAAQAYASKFANTTEWERRDIAYQCLSGYVKGFWTQHKPRVRAA